MTAINLTGVEKVYKGKVHALRGVDLTVHPGEVFGLLGPNGAGKSTLVKILMTVIRPTRCHGTVLGKPVGHKPTLARVGYLPEHHQFPSYLTGAQILDFFGAMSGVPRRERRARTGRLLDLVGMSEWSRKRVGGYSKGMRQRVGIAQALINDPALVILDEPTDGVDPTGRREIRAVLEQLRTEGRAVFINSHLLSELETISDRVAIMVQGKVHRQGTIDELTAGRRQYRIIVSGTLPPGFADEAAVRSGVEIAASDRMLEVRSEDPERIQPIIDLARSRSISIEQIHRQRPSLEDLFMETVSLDDSRGAPGARRSPRTKKERP
jgi:ABC-2 type transport system ATP-binding protein